jgi:hypothetical protein
MVNANRRLSSRHAFTNEVAASVGDAAGERGMVVVVATVVVGCAELSELGGAVGVESELQAKSASTHTAIAAQRIIEST